MAGTIRVKAAVGADGITNFKALIRHPMDSGFVKDKDGNLIPPHHIKVVTVKLGDRTLFTANWGPAVSKDPYLEFRFEGGNKGDTLTVSWIDNEGETDSTEATIS